MSYYKDQIPQLIEKMKVAVGQCLEIIERDIDAELSDDKIHNVLKAKRMAAEDAKHYAKEIDILENEKNGVEEEQQTTIVNPAKKFAIQ